MPRIQPVTKDTADSATANLLGSIEKKMGSVPNLISTMAASPAVAKAYLGFSQSLSSGALSPKLREQIALSVGQSNGCDYCLAAHSALGQAAGLSQQETDDARRGIGIEDKETAALRFAQKLVVNRGIVSDDDFQTVQNAGFSEGDIAEIIANVALNIFTNYFNHVAETEIDFPAASELAAA